jgi:glycosyltransferase involved in cell wall biosynthesis
VEAGLARGAITVRPNSAADPGPPATQGAGVLFVGRLDEEKGAALLVEACRRMAPGTRVTIIGDGRLRGSVESLAAGRDDVSYLGPRTVQEVRAAMVAAAAVVVPSVCYEGFPRVVAEAFAHGRPVLATAIGPLPSLVTDDVGWTVDAEPDLLASALAVAGVADSRRGAAARATYLERYTPERTMAQLLAVYDEVVP